MVAVGTGLGRALIACSQASRDPGTASSAAPQDPDGAVPPAAAASIGEVGLTLTLPGGERIGSLTYHLSNGASTYDGNYPIGDAGILSFVVGSVASGFGYTVTLSAGSDGTVTCSGRAGPFAVSNRATSMVRVSLVCANNGGGGVPIVNAVTSNCGVWNTIVADPSSASTVGVDEGGAGNTVTLYASATATAPGLIGFSWSVPPGDGTISGDTQDDAGNDTATYTCPSWGGTYTVTLAVTDGPLPPGGGCDPSLTTGTVTVTCVSTAPCGGRPIASPDTASGACTGTDATGAALVNAGTADGQGDYCCVSPGGADAGSDGGNLDGGGGGGGDGGGEEGGTKNVPCGSGCAGQCIPGGCLETLASDQVYPFPVPYAIAVDATSVYFTTEIGGAVMKVPLGGGSPTTLAAGQTEPFGIAVDAAYVYWTAFGDGTVMKVPLNGGTATVLASGQLQPFGIAIDAANVYWTNYGDGTVMKAPLGGGAPTVLASGQSEPLHIVVDGTSAYWTDYSGGTVMAVPVTGGMPVALASGQDHPQGVAVDAVNVYWDTFQGGTVMSVPLGGGAPTELATGQLQPSSLTTDGTNVYWTNAGDGDVVEASVLGGGPIVDVFGQAEPYGIAVDATSLYWTTESGGTVMKLTPK